MLTKTIEELLVWAFVHELPKGGGVNGLQSGGSAWGSIASGSEMLAAFGALGIRAQVSQPLGYEPRGMWIDQGEAHGDARAIGEAVAGLGRVEIAMPADWSPVADWDDEHGLVAAAVRHEAERFAKRPADEMRRGLAALVIGTAILGKRPDWTVPEPPHAVAFERNGKPAWFVKRASTDRWGQPCETETDGYNPKTQRPVPGAYRRYRLNHNPAGDILSRLDWQLWIAALRWLEARLGHGSSCRLTDHRIRPFDERMTPWQAMEGSGPELVLATGLRKEIRADADAA